MCSMERTTTITLRVAVNCFAVFLILVILFLAAAFSAELNRVLGAGPRTPAKETKSTTSTTTSTTIVEQSQAWGGVEVMEVGGPFGLGLSDFLLAFDFLVWD